ncbi:MAG: HMA2 domain-containing protein [Thermodesulfobacteriota bacterium]
MKAKKKSRIKPQQRSRQFLAAEGLEVIHHIPGRVRFRIPALRGSEALRLHVERELSVSQGIRSVSASAGTGTVLVHFEEKLITAAFTRAFSGVLAGFERLPARERVLPPESGTNPVRSYKVSEESALAWHTAEVHAGERRILIPEEPWKPTFRRGLAEDPDLSWLMRLTALCNEAEIQGRGISPWQGLWTNLVCLSLASERPRFAMGAMQMPEESGAIPGPQEIRDTAAG